jgi:hypothetical protein
MKTITKNQIASRTNPHYFIFKNSISFLTKDAEIIDVLPFKDASEAKKYAKKIGCFYEFINGFSCDKVMNKIIIK